ncbi:hypothetical protein NKG94_49465 [Micromonospora sp. M12]
MLLKLVVIFLGRSSPRCSVPVARHGGDLPVLRSAGRRRGPSSAAGVQLALRPQQPRTRRLPHRVPLRSGRLPDRGTRRRLGPSRWSRPPCTCRRAPALPRKHAR